MRKVLFLALAVLFVVGCVSLSPKQGVILNIMAKDAGYLIAKENPDVGKKILSFSAILPDMDKVNFESWANLIIDQLVDDEFLAMSFKDLLSLVQIEIEGLDSLEEHSKVYNDMIENFCFGLGVGLK